MQPAFPKPQRRGKSARRGVKRERPPRRRSMSSRAIQQRAELEQWVIEVKQRAGWRCERCSVSDARMLDAHHVRGKKAHPELRLNIMNGVALCRQHHDGAHGRFGVRLKREFKEWFAGRRFEDFEAIFAPGERRPWVESLPR